MNEDATLSAIRNHLTEVRDSLDGIHMDTPASEIVAKARRRRMRRGLSAMGATCVVLGLAVGLVLQPGSQVRPVHVHLTAWSADTTSDGMVLLDVRQLTHAALLAHVLEEAGVPAVVTTAQCLDPQNQNALGQTTALRSGAVGVLINPAAIPGGTAILISVLRVTTVSRTGERQRGRGFGWGLVKRGAPLDCHGSGHYYYTH